MMRLGVLRILLCGVILDLVCGGVSAFQINVIGDAGFNANPDAVAAMQRASARWESVFTNPITVNIDVSFDDLGSPTAIAGANPAILEGGYSVIRDALATASGNFSLPTAEQFSGVTAPFFPDSEGQVATNFSLTGISATKANLKAMGFVGLDDNFGASDGTIRFGELFPFDFDNSNGVSAGTMDFETVAVHEIGHILGFVSMVDTVDFLLQDEGNAGAGLTLNPMDLYRFNEANVPTTLEEFTLGTRELTPGEPAVMVIPNQDGGFDQFALSEGAFFGDGRQAAHWKDDALTGEFLGVMDPTISFGETFEITQADLRYFEALGYQLVLIPEPGGLALSLLAVLCLLRRRRC